MEIRRLSKVARLQVALDIYFAVSHRCSIAYSFCLLSTFLVSSSSNLVHIIGDPLLRLFRMSPVFVYDVDWSRLSLVHVFLKLYKAIICSFLCK